MSYNFALGLKVLGLKGKMLGPLFMHDHVLYICFQIARHSKWNIQFFKKVDVKCQIHTCKNTNIGGPLIDHGP